MGVADPEKGLREWTLPSPQSLTSATPPHRRSHPPRLAPALMLLGPRHCRYRLRIRPVASRASHHRRCLLASRASQRAVSGLGGLVVERRRHVRKARKVASRPVEGTEATRTTRTTSPITARDPARGRSISSGVQVVPARRPMLQAEAATTTMVAGALVRDHLEPPLQMAATCQVEPM